MYFRCDVFTRARARAGKKKNYKPNIFFYPSLEPRSLATESGKQWDPDWAGLVWRAGGGGWGWVVAVHTLQWLTPCYWLSKSTLNMDTLIFRRAM